MNEMFLMTTQMLLLNLFTWEKCAKRRYPIIITIALYVLLRNINIAVGALFTEVYTDGQSTILAGMLYMIPIYLAYKINLKKLVSIFFFVWLYTFLIYCNSVFVAAFLGADWEYSKLTVQTILFVATYYPFYAKIIPKYVFVIENISSPQESLLLIASVAWFAMIFLVFRALTEPPGHFSQVSVFLVIVVAVLVNYLAIYRMVQSERRTLYIEQREKFQLERYQTTRDYLEDVRKLIHDINKHNIIIQKAIADNDLTLLKKYSNSISEVVNQKYDLGSTGSRVLDALLFHLKEQCRQKDIRLTIACELHQIIEISEFELTIIVGNILENALEAAAAATDRWISVTGDTKEHFFVIDVSNGKPPESNKLINRVGIKEKLPVHMGLKSVKGTVEELGGIVKVEETPDTFRILISLPL